MKLPEEARGILEPYPKPLGVSGFRALGGGGGGGGGGGLEGCTKGGHGFT